MKNIIKFLFYIVRLLVDCCGRINYVISDLLILALVDSYSINLNSRESFGHVMELNYRLFFTSR